MVMWVPAGPGTKGAGAGDGAMAGLMTVDMITGHSSGRRAFP